jgi:hypothetical protein
MAGADRRMPMTRYERNAKAVMTLHPEMQPIVSHKENPVTKMKAFALFAAAAMLVSLTPTRADALYFDNSAHTVPGPALLDWTKIPATPICCGAPWNGPPGSMCAMACADTPQIAIQIAPPRTCDLKELLAAAKEINSLLVRPNEPPADNSNTTMLGIHLSYFDTRTPAEKLRDEAAAIEQKDAAIVRFRMALESCE